MNGARQRGSSGLSLLLTLAVLAVGIYVGYQLLPPVADNFQLKATLREVTRMSVYNGDSDQAIRAKLIRRARFLSLPVDARQISVEHDGRDIRVAVLYDVTVPLPLHPVTFHFHDTAQSRPITEEP